MSLKCHGQRGRTDPEGSHSGFVDSSGGVWADMEGGGRFPGLVDGYGGWLPPYYTTLHNRPQFSEYPWGR